MSTMADFQGFSSTGRIVTITNPYAEIILHQAHEIRDQGDYLKALEIYDQVLEIDPRHAQAHHNKGDIYDLMGKYEDAVACYDSALECDPFNAETWYNKGVTLSKMGCPDDSAECIHNGVYLAV